MRAEDPPNKEVHAEDLASALAELKTDQSRVEGAGIYDGSSTDAAGGAPDTPMSLTSDNRAGSWPLSSVSQRSRSSTLIYLPEDHGSSPDLPAVMVEDTTHVRELSPIDMSVKKVPPKTSLPPVELME